MKRKLPNDFAKDDEFEIDFINKMPALEGDEKETDAIEYRFDFTLRHFAAVNLLYSKCIEFMQENVVKSFYRNCAGEIHFADILLKDLLSVFPYFSGTRVKLSSMVTQVVKNVYNWIRHIDRTVFNVRVARQSMALDFVHHIVITSRGTIDYAKSAEQLLTNPKFDAFDRLKIICVHCLEPFILPMVTTVPVPTDPSEIKKVFKGTMKMIEFWRQWISSGRFMRNAPFKIDDEVYNAAGVTNTEALKYLWSKTSGEDRNEVLIKVMRRSEADFQCYLLSQLNGEDQQSVFKVCGGTILNNLFEDFIWGGYLLSTAYHSRNVIPSRQYYEFMKRITFCMQFDKNQCRNEIIFRQLWRYATKRIRDLIFRHENSMIFYWFRNDINAEYLLTLFSDASAGFKQNFILSNTCLKACMNLIQNNNVNVLETIIKKTYTEDDEKHHFKKILLNDERCKEAICHLISDPDKVKFDSIIRWFFNDEEEAAAFKKTFVNSSQYLALFKSILNRAVFENANDKIVRDEVDFTELDEKICWLLSDEQEINDFKQNSLALSDSFQNEIRELVKKEQYGLIEQLFCWCLANDRNVAQFKADLYDSTKKTEIIALVFELLWKNDDFKSLDNFVQWCFESNQYAIDEFKRTILSSHKEAENLWGSMLYREEYAMADQFIQWCGLITPAQTEKLKNELVMSLNLEHITNDIKYTLVPRDGETFGLTEEDRLAKCQRMIRWFNPTIDTYQKYRQLLYNDQLKYGKYCNLIGIFMGEKDNGADNYDSVSDSSDSD